VDRMVSSCEDKNWKVHWLWNWMEICLVGELRTTLMSNSPTSRSCPGLRTGQRRHLWTFDRWRGFYKI